MFGRRNILGQSAADAFDGIPHFLADLFMGLDRLCLTAYTVTGELVAGLGHAKLVGRQFGSAHTVEQVVFFGNGLALLDAIAPQAAIEALVAGVVEHAEHFALYTSILRCTG